jgi:hypothetical protein
MVDVRAKYLKKTSNSARLWRKGLENILGARQYYAAFPKSFATKLTSTMFIRPFLSKLAEASI